MLRLLPALSCAVLLGCGTYRTARVVELGDVPELESVRRPDGNLGEDAREPLLLDEQHAFYRTVVTEISVEPSLEEYVRSRLEDTLQVELATVRVDFVGYRYAYYFPSRRDDFVLRVELSAEGLPLEGEFEGVIGGDELLRRFERLDWKHPPPDTTVPADLDHEDELHLRVQRLADRVAYDHRQMIRLATERLAMAVPTRLLVPEGGRDPSEPLRFVPGQ